MPYSVMTEGVDGIMLEKDGEVILDIKCHPGKIKHIKNCLDSIAELLSIPDNQVISSKDGERMFTLSEITGASVDHTGKKFCNVDSQWCASHAVLVSNTDYKRAVVELESRAGSNNDI